MTEAAVQARADMGSWAGDITDLMYCAENVDIPDRVDTSETDVDVLAANIRARYLGVPYSTLNEVDHSFTDTDLYGDMDAFYLTTEMNLGGSLSTLAENYFTAGLTDESRASYFLTNRLGGMVTKEGIRSKVLKTYTGNTLIGALASSYSFPTMRRSARRAAMPLRTICSFWLATRTAPTRSIRTRSPIRNPTRIMLTIPCSRRIRRRSFPA